MRVALAFLALLLPGGVWWVWFGERKQDPLLSLAHIIGISLSFIILLAEGMFIIGGSFSLSGLGLILAVLAVAALMGIIKRGVRMPPKYRAYTLMGCALFGLVIAWRLYQSRELLLPNWVDSQHHYLIIRAILDKGGLPDNLSPYLSIPFYYHYGFHAVTAVFTALSGVALGDAMLLVGQVLNAAVGLSVYALGKALWKDWRPAGMAALLVSFATRMPAYYLSWGRYTLLTGLVLLPLALAFCLQILRAPRRVKNILALAMLTAGVLLSHYFAALLLATFLVLLTPVTLADRRRQFKTSFKQVSRLAAGALIGLALAAPWLLRVARYSILSTGLQSNLPESLEAVLNGSGDGNYIWKLLGPASNHWLLLPAGVGLVLGIIRRKTLPFALWTGTLALLTLPWSLTVEPFRSDHFAIVSFLPVSLWGGWLFVQAGAWLGKWLKSRWVTTVMPILLVGVWIVWGMHLSLDIINPTTVLVTADDLAALAWVKQHTPAEGRFFINTTYWQNGTYRGVDGGGWLLPITGRWALVPTVFYGFSPDIETRAQLRQWGEDASDISTCSTEFWQLVEGAELDWIYIRAGVGSLQAEDLTHCEGLNEVYANDSVHIFQLEHE